VDGTIFDFCTVFCRVQNALTLSTSSLYVIENKMPQAGEKSLSEINRKQATSLF
jgi:hypothetical protein